MVLLLLAYYIFKHGCSSRKKSSSTLQADDPLARELNRANVSKFGRTSGDDGTHGVQPLEFSVIKFSADAVKQNFDSLATSGDFGTVSLKGKTAVDTDGYIRVGPDLDNDPSVKPSHYGDATFKGKPAIVETTIDVGLDVGHPSPILNRGENENNADATVAVWQNSVLESSRNDKTATVAGHRRRVVILRDLQHGFGFGFADSNLESSSVTDATTGVCSLVTKMSRNGAATKAGLLLGDVIEYVNDVNVCDFSHEEVVAMIVATESMLELGVLRPEAKFSTEVGEVSNTSTLGQLQISIPSPPPLPSNASVPATPEPSTGQNYGPPPSSPPPLAPPLSLQPSNNPSNNEAASAHQMKDRREAPNARANALEFQILAEITKSSGDAPAQVSTDGVSQSRLQELPVLPDAPGFDSDSDSDGDNRAATEHVQKIQAIMAAGTPLVGNSEHTESEL